ncbi:MAG: glutamate racemase [Methylobacterium sp.]|nr:glutamate racemase [Methylobacterium sp.]
MNDSPVGVFDSGVGGVSVLHHIRDALPGETLLYCADSRYAPYGNKTPEQIRRRSALLTEFLLAQGAKAIVVACNTATAAAAAELRARYAVPIVAMEPAVKPAAEATRSGVIGVLATVGTLQSAQFAALLENYGRNVKVVTQACHGLVECVERGELDTDATRQLLRGYVAPLLQQGADTLVLGCTHYPFLRDLIREAAGPGVALVDTGAAVARQLCRRLDEAGLLAGHGRGGERFWTSGDPAQARAILPKLWGTDVEVEPLPAVTASLTGMA